VTTDSQATITQTAEELLDLFQKHKIGRVKIICSKFLRCLMTAEKIAAALKRGGMEVLIPFQI
jgi:broad specificity phosphatase PhoE